MINQAQWLLVLLRHRFGHCPSIFIGQIQLVVED
jgi:hypothetical protein